MAVEVKKDAPADDKISLIVHIQRFTKEDGQPGEKVHGPMPVSEWAAYEKEHGL